MSAPTIEAPAAQAPLLEVLDPYNGEVIAHLAQHSVDDVEEIMARARLGASLSRDLSRFTRHQVLDRAARILEARAEEAATLIVREAGKTIAQARKEVTRAVTTISLSADTARSFDGEVIPFDAYEGSANRRGWYTREPLGVILAITPYNDALNLVAHKIGPAIAGGNAVILKPSQFTPLTARFLVEVLQEAGLPDEIITVVHGDRQVAQALVAVRDIRMVSFTGGFATGEAIARTAGLKKLAMELGGNAPVLVFADADISAAVEACVSGAFWAAGQNCVGAQRILIERSVYAEFRDRFAARTSMLRAGDPASRKTDVGPMISVAAATHAERVVDDAVRSGARVLAGHRREGSVYWPTALENVSPTCEVWREEAFAPVVILTPFDTEDDGIAEANSIEYALHAAAFTSDITRALRVAEALDAGGVMINDSSDYRIDSMPFGGSKYGSMGREGVRFAYEEMTQPKVTCITT
ncbi:aldehyde dehydrogenase family protein [Microbacterium foliorum]|uniref:aldehyde dehydrogenase family protein n=1 Tax=Microbacterium foliorum TaxID=104336 RepID=UPI001DEBDA0E|nr:aldehyde dehydrogenase family protein [Microbacterium foliorum]CAH0140930.1 Sulfoacetaldehyde dehydrogenase [Microbacterium foliorum]CAH0188018.1 Sulfoacetaldehyde dehydrogenase [Microbacterium foliorum]